jgi:hypothetical protein
MRLKQTGGKGRGDGSLAQPGDQKGGELPSRPASQQSGGIVVALPFENMTTASQPEGDRQVDDRLLDRQIQAAIGRQLRMMYNDVASEPVPNKFLKLLDELASKPDDKP